MIDQLLKELKRNVLMMIATAIIEQIDDAAESGLQKNQVTILDGETHGEYDRYQEYGFSSVPLPGCQAAVACIGGSRSNGLVIATDDPRYRPQDLEPGETIVYNNLGDYIKLTKDRKMKIVSGAEVEVTAPKVIVNASTEVQITSPVVKMSGNLEVDGNILADGNVSDGDGSMAEMRGVYNTHTHEETDDITAVPNQLME